jgi:hypothetical protein
MAGQKGGNKRVGPWVILLCMTDRFEVLDD